MKFLIYQFNSITFSFPLKLLFAIVETTRFVLVLSCVHDDLQGEVVTYFQILYSVLVIYFGLVSRNNFILFLPWYLDNPFPSSSSSSFETGLYFGFPKYVTISLNKTKDGRRKNKAIPSDVQIPFKGLIKLSHKVTVIPW